MKHDYTKVLILLFSALLTGCSGGRNVNYAPQVYNRLSYLQRLSEEMAKTAGEENAIADTAERRAVLAAISRGTVQEIEQSVGGFYLTDKSQHEAIFQGGAQRGERALDPVEVQQLQPLVQKVISTGKYQEEVVSFYEHEVAQVAAPVERDGKIAGVAWIRSALPSELKEVTQSGSRFGASSTRPSQQE
ncbi:MAG: hypothetical protein JO317_01975 [Verrucomicrobiae bacterium]|nr:hypothetical protein [Verrucomicrobiae bacterium]